MIARVGWILGELLIDLFFSLAFAACFAARGAFGKKPANWPDMVTVDRSTSIPSLCHHHRTEDCYLVRSCIAYGSRAWGVHRKPGTRTSEFKDATRLNKGRECDFDESNGRELLWFGGIAETAHCKSRCRGGRKCEMCRFRNDILVVPQARIILKWTSLVLSNPSRDKAIISYRRYRFAYFCVVTSQL